MDENVCFPIGHFEPIFKFSNEDRIHIISQIPGITKTLRETTEHLNDDQLCTPYRDGGWTITQIVHRLADNDMNAYIRLLYGLHPDQFRRKLRTEVLGTITLDIAIQRFVWHGQHHIAQIKSCITSQKW